MRAALPRRVGRLVIENDDFIRTTEPRHEEVVRRRSATSATRARSTRATTRAGTARARGLRPRRPRSRPQGLDRETARQLSRRTTSSGWAKYRDALVAHIEANPDSSGPSTGGTRCSGSCAKGLGDLCISRPKARLSWGIPLPFDDYVTYVWFDALLNYLTGCGYRDDALFARTGPPTST